MSFLLNLDQILYLKPYLFILNQYKKNFPFPCLDENSWKMGYSNIFEIWGHYSDHYKNLIQELTYSSEKLNKYYSEFNIGDMDNETARNYKNKLLSEMKNQFSFNNKI